MLSNFPPNCKRVILPYLGLKTSELGDSKLRRILSPLAENVLKTSRSDYWHKTPEFGSKNSVLDLVLPVIPVLMFVSYPEFWGSKMSDSNFWVNWTSCKITSMKEV